MQDAPTHDDSLLQSQQKERIPLWVGRQGHAHNPLSVHFTRHTRPIRAIPRLDTPIQRTTQHKVPRRTLQCQQRRNGFRVALTLPLPLGRRRSSSIWRRRASTSICCGTTFRGDEKLAVSSGQIPQSNGAIGGAAPQNGRGSGSTISAG